MPSEQLLDRVRELRGAGRTPKEIARALNMPPSAVAPLIRSVAAAEGRTREDTLIGCWISPGWSSSVQAPERPDWPGSTPSGRTGHSGLVTVLVARDRDGKPMYISGPHDDGDRIIRKLRRRLGDGNYDFVHMISS